MVKLLPVTTWIFLVIMLFSNNNTIFQDDSSFVHIARSVQSWFEEHEDAVQHLTWSAQ
jgi:hypothetical protein